MKREAKSNTIQIIDDVIANTEKRISSWAKLKRVVGCIQLCKKKMLLHKKKFLQCCIKRNPTQKDEPNIKAYYDKNQLDMVLIQKAEHQTSRASKRRHFSDDIRLMETNKCEKKNSSTWTHTSMAKDYPGLQTG